MQLIPSASSLSSAANRYPPTGASRTSDLTRLEAGAETHTDLSIVTAAGDRITLSAESLLRVSSVDLKYHRLDQGSSLDLHGTASATQVRNSIEVSVQGQIDPQEEADARQLVEKLEKVVTNFLGGDIEGAVSKALKIGDLGTVASFQLDVRQSEQIAITREQQSSDRSAPQNGTHQGATASLANRLADGIREANIDQNKLLKLLPHALRHLFDRLDPKVSEQDLSQLSSDIEAWLTGKPRVSEPAID